MRSRLPWTKKINEVIEKGIIVCVVAQTIFGRLDPLVYSNGRELLKTGVIFLEDMLAETAFVKLGWVLGHKEWVENKGVVKEKMLHNFSKEDDIEMCSNYINTIIEETIKKYPLLDDPIFIGASQGGVVALHACVDHKIKCKAAVSLLGYYEFKLDNNQLSDKPILMINGELDNVIPYDWVEISKLHLKTKNKNVTDIFLNLGHQITKEMIDISMLWIHKLIQ
jgi:predicted esterase